MTHRILRSSIDIITDRQVDFSADSVVPHWKETYYSLVMLEKIIYEFKDLCFTTELEVIWEAICELLLHPHSWIRSRSVNLIDQYFSHIEESIKESHQKPLGSYFLMSSSRIFHIAASLCCQLKTPHMDDADSNLMNHCIEFAICL